MNTVTKEEVMENMQDVICKTATEFNKPVTYVTVRMKNDFTLRESTTCVDPANYNEEVGKQICLEKIEDKIWCLLGYALQDKMYKENKDSIPRNVFLNVIKGNVGKVIAEEFISFVESDCSPLISYEDVFSCETLCPQL